jgi:hypothetical protein
LLRSPHIHAFYNYRTSGKRRSVLHIGHCKDKDITSVALLANSDQLLGTAQTITTGIAIHSGFGRASGLLSSADVLRTRQAFFAAELLYLLANTATKCSVALLFARLLSQRSPVKVCYGVVAICAAWGLCAALVQGVVCSRLLRTSSLEDRPDTVFSCFYSRMTNTADRAQDDFLAVSHGIQYRY